MLEELINLPAILVFVLVFCITVAYLKAKRPPNFPPGPATTPFLGNCSVVSGNYKLHKTFSQLNKEYGPIFGLQLGWCPCVVISRYDILKEALIDKGDMFSDRTSNVFLLTKLMDANKGIINCDGDLWKGTRRMALSSLRDFGFGKAGMEASIGQEAEVLVAEIGKTKGKPFKFNLLFNKAASNIINAMLFGERYDYENEELVNVLQGLSIMMKNNGLQLGATILIPYLFPFMFFNVKLFKNLKYYRKMFDFLKEKIKGHRQKFDPANISNFLDIFLEMEMKDSKNPIYGEKNLLHCIVDLIIAGAETTSTTLLWAMLFMLKNPHVQDRCRKDIINVIGDSRTPCLKDRESLPYVEATICEVQRLGNIAPHAVMHCTSEEVTLQGYTLPQKCIVIPNLYDIHLDPETWKDPEVFNPERFLNEEGKVFRPPQFQPFSMGKRMCLGDNLAKTEMFLFFTAMLQRYKFSCQDEGKLPDITSGEMGITLSPDPYEIIATPI